MTSPPYKYVCKHCKKDNWIMPFMDNFNFECIFCKGINRVIQLPFNRWFTIKRKRRKTNEK